MEKVSAGIVLYNPDPDRLRESIQRVRSQAEVIFLVDNGSENIAAIRALAGEYPQAILTENGENLGIARALNQACEAAVSRGYAWILTLDQDTVIPEGMIDELAGRSAPEDIGILCPAVYYEGASDRPAPRDATESVKACMTSGSLTRLSAWRKVGGFREDFFIDFVDNDFCQKLRNAGYRIVRDHACVMNHQLGQVRVIRWFGRIERRHTTHQPWRFYYMIRNNIVFVRDYRKDLNTKKEWTKIFYIALTGWLYTKRKKETLRCILQGRKDAKAGRMGKRI